MPILDTNTAGVNYAIGFDIRDINTAGTNYSVKTIYDVNTAGTSSTVWTAEDTLYPGSTVNINTSQGSAGYAGSFYAGLSTSTGNSNSQQPYIAINTSLYTSLQVTYSLVASGTGACSAIYLHNSISVPAYVTYYANAANYTQRAYVQNSSSGTVTVTWDISGLSGTYYLACCCYLATALSANMTSTITSVIGIPQI